MPSANTASLVSMRDERAATLYVTRSLVRLRSGDFLPDFRWVRWKRDARGSHLAFRCLATSARAVAQASKELRKGLREVESLLWYGEDIRGFLDLPKRFAPALWGDKRPTGKGKGYLVFMSSAEGFNMKPWTPENQLSFPVYLIGRHGDWLKLLGQIRWGLELKIPLTIDPSCIEFELEADGRLLTYLNVDKCPELVGVDE